jgi:hypothetical protein
MDEIWKYSVMNRDLDLRQIVTGETQETDPATVPATVSATIPALVLAPVAPTTSASEIPFPPLVAPNTVTPTAQKDYTGIYPSRIHLLIHMLI